MFLWLVVIRSMKRTLEWINTDNLGGLACGLCGLLTPAGAVWRCTEHATRSQDQLCQKRLVILSLSTGLSCCQGRIVFEGVSQHCVLTEAKHQHTHTRWSGLLVNRSTVETVEVPMKNELNTDYFSIQLKFCSLRLPVWAIIVQDFSHKLSQNWFVWLNRNKSFSLQWCSFTLFL